MNDAWIVTLNDWYNCNREKLISREEILLLNDIRHEGLVKCVTSLFIFNKENGKVNPMSYVLGKVIWFDGVIHLMFNLWY